MSDTSAFDAIILGGGHNGLAAAAYLAKAGKSVLLLEKLEHAGGAAVSARAFDGVDARLSRYSYLVSLLPRQIIEDLGLRIELARRRYSSYTPDPALAGRALLIDNGDAEATAASFTAVGAADGEFAAFNEFYAGCRKLTETLWPTMTSPLRTRSEARSLAAAAGAAGAWEEMIERPIAEAITARLKNDLVRGVVLTDALIGTFSRADDADLQQNICFLYHLIGGGTGDWESRSAAWARSPANSTRCPRRRRRHRDDRGGHRRPPDGTVAYRLDGAARPPQERGSIANVAPVVLDRLRNAAPHPEHGLQRSRPRRPSSTRITCARAPR